MNPSDIVTFLDFEGLMFSGLNHASIYDEHNVVFSGLTFYGLNHRLIFFGLSNAFDHFYEFRTLGKIKFFEVDGHLHFNSRKVSRPMGH